MTILYPMIRDGEKVTIPIDYQTRYCILDLIFATVAYDTLIFWTLNLLTHLMSLLSYSIYESPFAGGIRKLLQSTRFFSPESKVANTASEAYISKPDFE